MRRPSSARSQIRHAHRAARERSRFLRHDDERIFHALTGRDRRVRRAQRLLARDQLEVVLVREPVVARLHLSRLRLPRVRQRDGHGDVRAFDDEVLDDSLANEHARGPGRGVRGVGVILRDDRIRERCDDDERAERDAGDGARGERARLFSRGHGERENGTRRPTMCAATRNE